MKIIFLDVLKDYNKIILLKECNTSFKSIYISINENIVEEKNIFYKIKNKVKYIYLKYIFRKKLCNDKYIYITSYEFDKNVKLKEKILNLFGDRFVEILQSNTIKTNSIKYINKLDKNFKLLCIISKEISKTLLISYIEIFKHVDILYIESNFINNDFIKLINNINKEYGTSIAFTKDFDLKRYDIYLVFNNVDLSNYLLNKKSKYINLINSDNDIYSKEYLIYKKYENELINTDRYSKTKIGKGIINLLDI